MMCLVPSSPCPRGKVPAGTVLQFAPLLQRLPQNQELAGLIAASLRSFRSLQIRVLGGRRRTLAAILTSCLRWVLRQPLACMVVIRPGLQGA